MTATRRRNYLADGDAPTGFLEDDELPPDDIQASSPISPWNLYRKQATIEPPAVEDDTLEQFPSDGGVSAIQSSHAGVDPGYTTALDNLKTLAGTRPVQSSPKWWQRIAAAAAGAAAGYSNAAGRARPIDISEVQDNILHPGYKSKLSEWQSRVAPAEAMLDIAGKRQAATNAERELERKEALEGAQARYYQAHGDYMEGQGRQPASVEVTPEMADVSQGMFKVGSKIPATTATRLAEIAAGRYEKPEKTTVVTDPDMALRLGVKVGTPVRDSIYQAGVTAGNRPPRNLNAGDILLHPEDFTPAQVSEAKRQFEREHKAPADPNAVKPMTRAQSIAIETRKNGRLNSLGKQIQTRLRNAAVTGEDPTAIRSDEESLKQEIQDQYEGEIQAATGSSPGHFNYKLDGAPQAKPQAGPPARSTPITKTKVWNQQLNRFE